jgi:uncharacterized membrane protein
MDTQFSISIEINAPADRVYEVMSDTERWHEWTPSVTSIKRLRDSPAEVPARALDRNGDRRAQEFHLDQPRARHQGDRASLDRCDR